MENSGYGASSLGLPSGAGSVGVSLWTEVVKRVVVIVVVVVVRRVLE